MSEPQACFEPRANGSLHHYQKPQPTEASEQQS